jgi:hypothetical protein
MIEPFSLSELGIFIASCCASVTGLIYGISKSRCTRIKIGCCECDRDVIENDIITPNAEGASV